MKRQFAAALVLAVMAAITLGAQGAPAGWKQRIDASTDASDPDPAGDVKFISQGGGFHTVNPKAAIFWNPSNTVASTYTLKGTFAQNARSSHPNYLGLITGALFDEERAVLRSDHKVGVGLRRARQVLASKDQTQVVRMAASRVLRERSLQRIGARDGVRRIPEDGCLRIRGMESAALRDEFDVACRVRV